MSNNKKYLVLSIALVLLTFIGVSLAYFLTSIEGENKRVTIRTSDLRIIFTNGDAIEGTEIEPGWSVTKTFSVENKSKNEYKYNIVIEDLVNGTYSSDKGLFKPIYDNLILYNDEFFVLKDFQSYLEAQNKINNLYKDKYNWQKICGINIAHSGIFSSDRTIKEYATDIWGSELIYKNL